MNLFKNVISRLLLRLGQKNAGKPKLAPEKLPPEVLAKVMDEVRFLSGQHGVDVRALAPDEIPTIPKRADK